MLWIQNGGEFDLKLGTIIYKPFCKNNVLKISQGIDEMKFKCRVLKLFQRILFESKKPKYQHWRISWNEVR